MRRPFLFALALLASGASLAQDMRPLTIQGTRVIGGSADASLRGDFLSARVSPRVGVFVIDNLAIGARVDLAYSAVESGGLDRSSTAIALIPFTTLYLGEPGAAVQPYATASAGLRYQRTSFDGGRSDGYAETVGEIAAGALFQIGPNVGLTGEGYAEAVPYGGDPAFGVRGGIAVFLGR